MAAVEPNPLSLGSLLRLARQAACKGALEDGTPVGKACRHLGALGLLESSGPCSQAELSEYLAVNRSVMVKLIDDLEAARAVGRDRCPNDRRSYALALSSRGRRRAHDLAGALREREELACGRLESPERRRLCRLLARLAESRRAEPLPELLAGSLLFVLFLSGELAEQAVGPVLRRLGTDLREVTALSLLIRSPCSQRILGSWLSIGPATTVELVDSLESLGALKRARKLSDRRSYLLEATARGERLARRAEAALEAGGDALAAALAPGERAELAGLLVKLLLPPLERAGSRRAPAATSPARGVRGALSG